MPKNTPTRTTTVTVRIGPNMKATVKRYAAAREMSVSEFVLYALWTYIDSTPVNEDDEIDDATSQLHEELRRGVHGNGPEIVPESVRRG